MLNGRRRRRVRQREEGRDYRTRKNWVRWSRKAAGKAALQHQLGQTRFSLLRVNVQNLPSASHKKKTFGTNEPTGRIIALPFRQSNKNTVK